MKGTLTKEARSELQKRHKRERDKRICDRIKAVLAYDDGYSYTEIGRLLLLDDETIRRHVDAYIKEHKVVPASGGSTGYLNESETTQLKTQLRKKIYLYVKDICLYVQKTFNKIFSLSGMTKWLKVNNFRYKKPHGVPAKADKQRQAHFIHEYELLKAYKKRDEVILFSDSSHPQHQTQLAFGWIEKGIRKAEKMTACQKRVNLMGTINLETHAIEYAKADWVNSESIKAFLKQVIAANPEAKKIHLIWDNAGYHKSKEIKAFVKKTKIILHSLPPYSPNLNPIERLWKIMHEQVTYNKYYEKFSDFTEGILNFFKHIDRIKPIIRSRINDNFQQLVFP